MEFIIEEQNDESCFEISLDKDCFSNFKQNFTQGNLAIDFNSLNLGTKLYGKSKSETRQIQKNNYKIVCRMYRLIVKITKFIRRQKMSFNQTLYVAGLSKKKNNNDFMLTAMLNLRFNVKPKDKYNYIVLKTCEYLDKENALNQMCGDFKNGKCVKQEETNLDRTNGCCSFLCKYEKEEKPCKVKCVACKLFMCEFQKERGFCFFVRYIPLLRQHLTLFERWQLPYMLFKDEKQTIRRLRLYRFLNIFSTIFGLGLLALIIAAACT